MQLALFLHPQVFLHLASTAAAPHISLPHFTVLLLFFPRRQSLSSSSQLLLPTHSERLALADRLRHPLPIGGIPTFASLPPRSTPVSSSLPCSDSEVTTLYRRDVNSRSRHFLISVSLRNLAATNERLAASSPLSPTHHQVQQQHAIANRRHHPQ